MVSPPSVHQMVMTLEKRGLIARRPGVARSLRVLLSAEELPSLDDVRAQLGLPSDGPTQSAKSPVEVAEAVTAPPRGEKNMSHDESEHNYRPDAGYVPDAKTAMNIAEAVWLPIYGAAVLEKRPWRARLEKDVWIVEGSLPRAMPGSAPIVKISKLTGEILRVSSTVSYSSSPTGSPTILEKYASRCPRLQGANKDWPLANAPFMPSLASLAPPNRPTIRAAKDEATSTSIHRHVRRWEIDGSRTTPYFDKNLCLEHVPQWHAVGGPRGKVLADRNCPALALRLPDTPVLRPLALTIQLRRRAASIGATGSSRHDRVQVVHPVINGHLAQRSAHPTWNAIERVLDDVILDTWIRSRPPIDSDR
jgi:hypothetical protein